MKDALLAILAFFAKIVVSVITIGVGVLYVAFGIEQYKDLQEQGPTFKEED